MSVMKCFGYYLVKPLPRPGWSVLRTDKILSVSANGLSDKFPDLSRCFWMNVKEKDKIDYAKYLGLNSSEFPSFCGNVSDLFNSGRLSPDMRFRSLKDAVMLSRYIRNHRDYRLVGIFSESDIFSRYQKEGFFGAVGAGDDNITGKLLGCDILGSEGGIFDSYIINSLNEELDKKADIKIDRNTGLILNDYDDVKIFADMIQGEGEPVVWTPFEIHEFDIPEE